MDHLHPTHFWQDPAIGGAGLWLAISPWILGGWATGSIVASALLGLALALIAARTSLAARRAYWRWGALTVGVLIAVSPWLFGFSSERGAALHMVLVGLAAVLLALWAQARDTVPDPVSGEVTTSSG